MICTPPETGWPAVPLHGPAATHSEHHDLFHDTARWMLHEFTGGLSWWAGRSLGAQLGLGGTAFVVIVVGGLWWFLSRRRHSGRTTGHTAGQ